MMKHEFEKLAKREVTQDQYTAIEALYSASSLNKVDFVKSIKGLLKSIPEPQTEKRVLTISCADKRGCELTPNHCWIHTIKAELVDVDIKRGKYLLRKIPNSYSLGYSIDLHYYDEKIEWVA